MSPWGWAALMLIVVCGTVLALKDSKDDKAERTLTGIDDVVNHTRKITDEVRLHAVRAILDQHFKRQKPEHFGDLTGPNGE